MPNTDVKQDSAIESLIYDMVLENLIVESLCSSLGGRHICGLSFMILFKMKVCDRDQGVSRSESSDC